MRWLMFALLLGTMAESAAAVSPETYRERRQRVLDTLDGGVALLYGAEGEEPLIQESTFFYLTGVSDPGAALLLMPGEKRFQEILYLEPRNPEVEDWDGRRPGLGDSLEKAWGFQEIRRVSRLSGDLTHALQNSRTAVFLGPIVGASSPVPEALTMLRDAQSRVPESSLKNMADVIPEMRRVKSEEEIALVQRAVDVTGDGIKTAMLGVQPGLKEFQVASILEHAFEMGGAQFLGFPTIIGWGDNTTVLHYTRNNATVTDQGLILIDTGAAVDHYTADITRTFPVSGAFTPRERELYALVLKAADAAFAKVRAGNYYYDDVHLTAKKVLDDAGYGKYFIHGTGHYLGLDVHDVGNYDVPLEPGVIITVEPGIYIPEEGIGIRIEDDVLVTKGAPVLLSSKIPRTIEEIESFMKNR